MAEDGEGEAKKEEDKEPPSHLHRLLVPTLQTISHEEAAKENVDTEEEIRWGKQMQSERAAFLAKFQEEEAAKNAASAASPAPSSTGAGKGRRIGGAATAGTDKGTPSDADGAKGKRKGGAAAGDVSKRSRLASPIDFDDSSSDADPSATGAGTASSSNPLTSDPYLNPNVAISDRIRPSLWDLDLNVPRQHQTSQSLPQIVWARILERAQRGVGDACYESDEDEFAEEEAGEPERSRAEICRILTGLRGVVRHDIFERDNHEVRVKYGGYDRRDEEEEEYAAAGRGDAGYNGYRREEGRERHRLDLYSSSTPKRGMAYDEEEVKGRGREVDDLEEALLGEDGAERRRSVGRNGY